MTTGKGTDVTFPEGIGYSPPDDRVSLTLHTIPHRFLAKTLFYYVSVCHVVPLLGAIVALSLLPWYRPNLTVILVGLTFWALSLGIGISVGYHRLFSHRAFNTITPVRVAIAICGSMAGQGPLIAWVALHRAHHHYSDLEGDPHSPRLHGDGWFGTIRGLWHAHFGWVLKYDMPDPLHYCPDLLKDPAMSRVSRLFMLWFILGLLLPGLLTGAISLSLETAFMGILWAGCFRVAVSSQITWCINSICHFFGRHSHDTGDHSTNLAWLAIPSFGESWHNNHHAYPHSAAFGHTWWQLDLGYLMILFLKTTGFARDVKLPRPQGKDQ